MLQATLAHGARALARYADLRVPAIFESVVEHENVRVHVDVLERLARNRFGLRDVKASARVKDEHRHDIAVQRWVLMGSDLTIDPAELVHTDAGSIRGEGEVAPTRLFRRVELGDALALEAANDRAGARRSGTATRAERTHRPVIPRARQRIAARRG